MGIIRTAAEKSGFRQLEGPCRDILFQVAEAEASGLSTTMGDLAQVEAFGSYPTLLRRVQFLVECGWLLSEEDPSDRRARILTLTPTSVRAFEDMSEAVEKFIVPRKN